MRKAGIVEAVMWVEQRAGSSGCWDNGGVDIIRVKRMGVTQSPGRGPP